MLQVQQMIVAAIVVNVSLQIKSILGQGLNLGPATQKADTILSRNTIPVMTIQLFLKHKACKAALNKR